MFLSKFFRVNKIKEIYQRSPILFSINQITKTPQRYQGKFSKNVIQLSDVKAIKKLQVVDNVPKDSLLVYKCSIRTLIITGYHCCFFMILAVSSAIHYSFNYELEYSLYEPNKEDTDNNGPLVTVWSETEQYMLFGFLLLYNILGFLWCRKTALRMWYHNPTNSYYLFTPELFSKTGRKITFKPEEIKVRYSHNSPSVFRNMYTLKNRTYFITAENFATFDEFSTFVKKISK